MHKTYDVVAVCNALMDILVEAKDQDLATLDMNKGIMHLVDERRQAEVLDYFDKSSKVMELGGSALNATRALSMFDNSTCFIGTIGNDAFGRAIKDRMQQLNIHNGTSIVDGATGSCVILVTQDGERTMNTHLGASCLYSEKHMPRNVLEKGRVLHFCGYQWSTENQKTAIKHAIKIAKQASGKVSFDLADPFVVRECKSEFAEVIAESADIVFANQEEAGLMFGSTAEEAAEQIASHAAIAVIKLGAEGALIQKGEQVWRVPAVATQVVDTTAAGDMFAGGFLAAYVRDLPLDVCGQLGALLAADVISRTGAHLSEKVIEQAKKLMIDYAH